MSQQHGAGNNLTIKLADMAEWLDAHGAEIVDMAWDASGPVIIVKAKRDEIDA